MIKVNDEMDNSIVPTSPQIGTKVDDMQDIPENAAELDSGSMKYVREVEDDSDNKEVDLTHNKYAKVMQLLFSNGYTDSKFLGTSGYLVGPQPRDDLKLVCKSLREGFSVIYEGEVFPEGYFKYVNLATDLNAILADATNAETKDRHVDDNVNESYDHKTKYVLEVNDSEGTIKDLLDYIKSLANRGHSFPVMVDAEGDERHKKFFIDGDGTDKIFDITVMNEYYGYGHDTFSEEGLWVAQNDIKVLNDIHSTSDPKYVLIKAKMIKDAVVGIVNDIYKTVGTSPLAREIIDACDKLINMYGGDQDA